MTARSDARRPAETATRWPATFAGIALAVALVSTLVLVLAGFGALEAIRAVAGIVVVLVVPAIAVTAAVFAPGSLRREEVALLAPGLGLVVVILLGLAMDVVGVPIGAAAWQVGLGVISIVGVAIAIRRQRDVAWPAAIDRSIRSLPIRQAVLLGLAGVLMVSAVLISRAGALAQETPGFTALSMVPDGSDSLRVSVTNHLAAPMEFHVVVQAGTELLGNWSTGEVAPGQTWTTNVTVPPTASAATALLYRASALTTVDRRVDWLRPPRSSPS